MPYNEGKNEKTTKVFDTFIQVAEGATLLVAWDVALAAEQLSTLEMLARRLGYFGRAESLVEACVRTDLPEKIEQTHSVSTPLDESAPPPPRTELVRLLAPVLSADDGKPLIDHCHAHIFCEASGSRNAVTHITIWATMGFDKAACLALRKLNAAISDHPARRRRQSRQQFWQRFHHHIPQTHQRPTRFQLRLPLRSRPVSADHEFGSRAT